MPWGAFAKQGGASPLLGSRLGASVGVRTMSGIGTPVSYAETEIDDSEKHRGDTSIIRSGQRRS
jgi:hypothetical protein